MEQIRTTRLEEHQPATRNAVAPPITYRRFGKATQPGGCNRSSEGVNNFVRVHRLLWYAMPNTIARHNERNLSHTGPMTTWKHRLLEAINRRGMTTWKHRLLEAINRRGMDWYDLVKITGKPKSSVFAWQPDVVSKTTMLNGENAARICAALRINPVWLFFGEGPSGLDGAENEPSLSPKAIAVAKAYDMLTPEVQMRYSANLMADIFQARIPEEDKQALIIAFVK